MERVVDINGIQVPFKATASTTRKYRQQFGRDLLIDMQKIIQSIDDGRTLSAGDLEAFENVAYTMAKQADPTITADPDEWLDQFDMFSVYEILPQLIELWGLSVTTLEKNKKK